MDEQADALIGYFVDQARKSGLSWSQIGAAMGVSKQAAQKRFVPTKAADIMTVAAQPFSQFTPRAARALAAAAQLATAEGATAMGAAHLAAAQLSEPAGIAAKVIGDAGITAERLFAALGTGPADQGPANVDSETLLDLSFDDGAKAAMKGALRSALRLGHNYIGTEHLLLGVLVAGGPVTDAFSGLGLTLQRAEQLITAELADYVAHKGTN
jgi:ATP-dependent Clp protease ATP-binding subunit ClpA